MKKKTTPRSPQSTDLVPVKADRLRAAMDLGGWTVTTLARKLGKRENPQTVHYLSRGSDVKRCRAARRAALARILEVPEDWLAGGDFALPLPGVMAILKEVEGSPRVLLAVGRLFQQCYAAVQRDLEKEPRRPDTQSGWNAVNDVHWFMFSTLGALLNPARWQATLTHLTGAASPPTVAEAEEQVRQQQDLVKWFDPLPPSMWAPRPKARALDRDTEEAVVGFVRGWHRTLDTWFHGSATFDYQAFWQLAATLNPVVGHLLPQSWHGRPPVDTLPVAPPTSPYALVDWPLRAAAPTPS
jgi:hypothetical protein